MWQKSLILLCCTVALAVAEGTKSTPEYIEIIGAPDAVRSAQNEDFATSHKIPESIPQPKDDEEDAEERARQKQEIILRIQKLESKLPKLDSVDQSLDPLNSNQDGQNANAKRQARVQLENFSDSGVIHEDGIRKLDANLRRHELFDDAENPRNKDFLLRRKSEQEDELLPGVHISSEYPTTMRPVLTTERQPSFDFIPVNIIKEDSKENWTPFANRNFDDIGDVSLVPAGSSSKIQIKKGPNGKDYEYEYIYYYYDEEEDGKATAAASTNEGIRTTPSSRRGANSGRNKYTSVDRSTTTEPVSNEVLPNRNTIRGRNLENEEPVAEERLPTNTRFPPRSRSNHNTGTTEPSRNRGNRPRPNLDLVDSSSFRTHQEGPEFPQTLPKGPVRFLGVTPNENIEGSVRTRGRPQRIQEPAPVIEDTEEEAEAKRRPSSEPVIEVELNRGQPSRPLPPDDDEETPTSPPLKEDKLEEEVPESTTLETPTTEYPSAMDKVALDLYAFLQQGQVNLVDSATDDSNESTTVDEDLTTDPPTTTEDVSPTDEPFVSSPEPTTTTTTTTSTTTTTTTTTTTEAPTTTAAPALPGKGKFRRPGAPGAAGSRNRFKSPGSTTTTESSETTTRRNRFGGNSGGFKRPRPGAKQPVHEEEVQKDSASSNNAEKPSGSRNRYRGTGSRTPASTTVASATSPSSGVSRPSFNKLNINNRRRGRPTTAAPAVTEEHQESEEKPEGSQEVSTTAKPAARPRLPGIRPRPILAGKNNLRRPGQLTTTTAAPEIAETVADEPASEGTEEETHETPAETAPPTKHTTLNPLNKLRNRNRIQVQPKSTTRTPLPTAPRKSPLLPRRRTTEAPTLEPIHEDASTEVSEGQSGETEVTEAAVAETSTAASNRLEEVRARNSLILPRRRIVPRRPGQIIGRD